MWINLNFLTKINRCFYEIFGIEKEVNIISSQIHLDSRIFEIFSKSITDLTSRSDPEWTTPAKLFINNTSLDEQFLSILFSDKSNKSKFNNKIARYVIRMALRGSLLQISCDISFTLLNIFSKKRNDKNVM